jgi:rhamnogalacturonan hydrolase
MRPYGTDHIVLRSYDGNYSVPREAILQGITASVQVINSTINGEGDGQYLLDVLVIVNRVYHASHCFIHTLIRSLAATDFEFYSSNGKGAILGQGFLYRNANK